MAELTAAGFSIRTYDEIFSALVDEFRDKVSRTLDTTTESPLGQWLGLVAREIRSLEELALAVYSSQYPSGANGFSLANVGAITGSTPRPALPSTVQATVNVDPGTYAAGSLVAYVDGNPTARFANREALTHVGISAGDHTIEFISEETGPVRANAGTLTEIAEAVAGWHSVTNAEDATLGSEQETDTAFRLRRLQQVAAFGSTTVDAVLADVLAVPEVTYARVRENDRSTAVGGIDPNSLEVVVIGGDEDAIATAIFQSKAGGTGTTGSETRYVSDSKNESHAIRFSRPVEVDVYVTAQLKVDASYVGNTQAVLSLVDFANASFSVGDDVVYARLLSALMNMQGVRDVADLRIGFSPAPSGTANLSVAVKQLADFDTSRISITSSAFVDT